MAPLRVVRPLAATGLSRLKESMRTGVEGGHLPPAAAAILQRVAAQVRAALRGKKPLEEIEVLVRPDTCIPELDELFRRFRAAFFGEDIGLGCVCERREPEKLEENPKLWAAVRSRLLATPPRKGCSPNKVVFDLNVRPGERRLLVPGGDASIEEFLQGSEFVGELRQQHELSEEMEVKVKVGGKYLSEEDLDSLYEGQPDKRAAAARLDSGRSLPPEMVQGLLDGSFQLLHVHGRDPHELLTQINRWSRDSIVVLNGNRDIPLSSLEIYEPTGTYGCKRVENGAAYGKHASLACKGKGARDDRMSLRTVMLFPKSAP